MFLDECTRDFSSKRDRNQDTSHPAVIAGRLSLRAARASSGQLRRIMFGMPKQIERETGRHRPAFPRSETGGKFNLREEPNSRTVSDHNGPLTIISRLSGG
jgi:hypothetical protein